ncbi:hypothetical protein [Streptomyces sp. NPDC059010]|uniref:hypothetical protein n=1 Tax=Streptomyces sp. NPDC059010 TaxID=3346695 RepID=UPI00367C64E2
MGFEDTELYRGITDFAHGTPTWVQHAAGIWTGAGLLLFAALFVAAWGPARRDSTRAFAIAALAPLATAVAYVCSEVLKSVVTLERPCRAVPDATTALSATIAACSGLAAEAAVAAAHRPAPSPRSPWELRVRGRALGMVSGRGSGSTFGETGPGDHVLVDQPPLAADAEPEVVGGDEEFAARTVVAAVAALRGGDGTAGQVPARERAASPSACCSGWSARP